MRKIVLILSLFLTLGCSPDEDPFNPAGPTLQNSELFIGSFNVQIFGQAFMSDPDQVFYLREIIKRYDLILIQEIRDASGQSIIDLTNPLTNYDYSISPRLGRTSSKEQYAFIYNTSKLSLETCEQDDDINDDFEREPYTCVFRDIKSQRKFGLMALHTKPTDAQNELIAVEPLYTQLKILLNSPLILLGDLNSDCTYLTETEYQNLPLASYNWLLPQTVDTTTSATDCAYDNIIMDDNLIDEVISASVFDFQDFFSLSNDLTTDISDHYPIEFNLRLQFQE